MNKCRRCECVGVWTGLCADCKRLEEAEVLDEGRVVFLCSLCSKAPVPVVNQPCPSCVDAAITEEPELLILGGGKHFDQGKARVDLMPIEALEACGRAMNYGIPKYGEHNYMAGIPWASLYASVMRHLLRWFWDGRPDAESGESDLDHAIAGLAMIAYMVKHYPHLDNRPCKKHPPTI